MATRVSLDLELAPLLKVLRNRLEGLGESAVEHRDQIEVHTRRGLPFLMLELRRDHMNLDLWLPESKQEEARASGLGRAHSFQPDAVRVRFERAEDLPRVAHWLEESYRFVPTRIERASAPAQAESPAPTPPAPVDSAPIPVQPIPTERSAKGEAGAAKEGPASRAPGPAGKKSKARASKRR